MMRVDIGARAKKILHAVVSEYLATGEAVGSHTVTRRYGLEVSAATVRTVMGELEEVGFLRHAHTSGGRLPTERGLRYYVDTLLRVRNLTSGEKDDIRERLFLPFYSTKNRGSGLGLSIAAKIAQEHGGSIRAESNAPKGARFILRVPLTQPVAPPAANGAESESAEPVREARR